MGVLIRIAQNLVELIRFPLADIICPLLGTILCSGGGKGLRLHTPKKAEQEREP
jgi:hypothetical protein